MTITIETKFNKGDRVWFIRDNRVRKAEVKDSYLAHRWDAEGNVSYDISYLAEGVGRLDESELHPTEQSLKDHLFGKS